MAPLQKHSLSKATYPKPHKLHHFTTIKTPPQNPTFDHYQSQNQSPTKMASSSSSSASSSSTTPSSSSLTITQEQFNLFHGIDRTLFSRLVFNLNRDPAESIQVMALWLWLEQDGQVNDLVDKMLSWTDAVISKLADESVLCLKCIESDDYPFLIENHYDVPLLRSLTKSVVSLRFFHDHRLTLLRSVTQNVNDVCARAFQDIMQQVMQKKARSEENAMKQFSHYGPVISPRNPAFFSGVGGGVHMVAPPPFMGPNMNGANPGFLPGFDPFDLAVQRQYLNHEIGDLLSRIEIRHAEEEKEVPPEDRTIFLTFSKGYPITESEVKDYFTRRFGDCIEKIYMQEVPADEQPLYARLVLHSDSTIEVVLDHNRKAKFSIDGKHVWARKYVRKNPQSPSHSSTPPSQPASPEASSQT